MAINNPLVPGDPGCYDLKWIVSRIKAILAQLNTLDEAIEAKIFEGFLEHSIVQFKTVEEMLAAEIKDSSIVLTLGYHEAGDQGGLFYLVKDFNPAQCALDYFLTLDNNKQIAIPVVVTPYVTPEMFGAYGNDENADEDAINVAVKYGLPVELSATKTYKITGDVVLIDNNVLNGNGCTMKLYSTNANSHVIKCSGVKNVAVKNIHFDGTQAAGSAQASAIQFDNSSDVVVEHCTIENFTNNPIWFNECFNVAARNCNVKNSGLVLAFNTTGAIFDHIDIDGAAFQYALQLKSCINSVIKDCRVVNFDTDGVLVSKGNEADAWTPKNNSVINCVVETNSASGNGNGIRIAGPGSGYVVEGCQVKNVTGFGIYADEASDFSIVNCIVDTTTAYGIRCNNAANGTITGNVIRKTGTSGLELGICDGIVFNSNTMEDCNTGHSTNYAFVRFGASSVNVIIDGNMFRSPDGSSYIITGNTSATGIQITNNNVKTTGKFIVSFPDLATCVIKGNGKQNYRQFQGNTNFDGAILDIESGRIITYGYYDSAPTSGTWSAGDIMYKKTPNSTVKLGYIYTGSTWQTV